MNGRSHVLRKSVFAGLILSGFAVGVAPSIRAQIVPDISLDGEASVVLPSATTGLSFDRVVNGATRGETLFHSFEAFNVLDGQGVYFDNPVNINQIVTRVTGDTPSNIFGTLGVLGPADLFLLNPNGVIFGPNTQLDITGALVATTAHGVEFENYEFRTDIVDTPPLLTITAPIGLQYEASSEGIVLQPGTFLEAPPGQTLALLGNSITLNESRILALDSPIAIAAPQAGFIAFGPNLTLDDAGVTDFGPITLQASQVSTASITSSRQITLRGEQITLADGSALADFSTTDVDGGGIVIDAENQVIVRNSSGLLTASSNAGNAGDVIIRTGDLLVQDGSVIRSTTSSSGGSGQIDIRAAGAVILADEVANFSSGQFSQVGTQVEAAATGRGGNITIAADQIQVLGGTELSVFTRSSGAAGDISLQARSIEITGASTDNFSSRLNSFTIGSGKGGDVAIATETLRIQDGGLINISALLNSSGDGGNLTIQASDHIELAGFTTVGDGIFVGGIRVDTLGSGDGGSLSLSTPQLIVQQGSTLSAETFSEGNGGDIAIATQDLQVLEGGLITLLAREGSSGDGGSLTAQVSGQTLLSGMTTVDTFTLPSGIVLDTIGSGDAGSVALTTQHLTLQAGARLSTSTFGVGNAGSIEITASGTIDVAGLSNSDVPVGIFSNAAPSSSGNAGNLTIAARDVFVREAAGILTNTSGDGDGGALSITATDTVQVQGGNFQGSAVSLIFSGAREGAGRPGPLTIDTGTLQILDGGEISSNSRNSQPGGPLQIDARDLITIRSTTENRSVLSTDAFSEGPAGDLTLHTANLIVSSGGQISSGTFAAGAGGHLLINATDQITVAGGNIASQADAGSGNAGSVTILSQNLQVTEGGQISSGTFSAGNGGPLIVNSDRIELDGSQIDPQTGLVLRSGLFTQVSANSSGNAGTLHITTDNLQLRNGAAISARTDINTIGDGNDIEIVSSGPVSLDNTAFILIDSQGSGVGGNLTLQSQSLTVDQSLITAETQSTNGGNLTFQIEDVLLLRNGSNLATSAGLNQGGGNGGDITIDADFVVAIPTEDSNIRANAFTGQGGNVQITTQGIFGLTFQNLETPLSDITASSELGIDGTVTLTEFLPEPTTEIAQVAFDFAAPELSRGCFADVGESRFVITGRGGLPVNPADPLQGDRLWQDLEPLDLPTTTAAARVAEPPPTPTAETSLVEAQGWQVNADGKVILIAMSPTQSIPSQMGHPNGIARCS